jgi:hypothetical protein
LPEESKKKAGNTGLEVDVIYPEQYCNWPERGWIRHHPRCWLVSPWWHVSSWLFRRSVQQLNVCRNSMNNESLGDPFQRFWPVVSTQESLVHSSDHWASQAARTGTDGSENWPLECQTHTHTHTHTHWVHKHTHTHKTQIDTLNSHSLLCVDNCQVTEDTKSSFYRWREG